MILGWKGMEISLTTLNHELLLIPFSLSIILGITVHLDIPLTIPTVLTQLGLEILIIGLFIIIISKIIHHYSHSEN